MKRKPTWADLKRASEIKPFEPTEEESNRAKALAAKLMSSTGNREERARMTRDVTSTMDVYHAAWFYGRVISEVFDMFDHLISAFPKDGQDQIVRDLRVVADRFSFKDLTEQLE